MKKNRTMRIAGLLLALTLITSCFVGGTFAKYVSEATGTDTATVAKWSFGVGGADFTTGQTEGQITFSLFDAIKDSNITDDEENVADGLIAPGTSAMFDIVVANTSEVDAKFKIDFTVDGNEDLLALDTFTIGYIYDGADYTNDYISIPRGESKTVTVAYLWQFGGTFAGDEADTAVGIAAAAGDVDVTVTAKITAEQVD